MIEVDGIVVGFLASNCYVVHKTGSSCAVLVDPGADYERISAQLVGKGLTPRAVLLTHAHFDHCNAAIDFQSKGCRIYLHQADDILVHTDMNMARGMGTQFRSFTPDVLFNDGQEIDECGLKFKCLHTPGHTAGSSCFLIDNIIFSGDTLFSLGIGRTDMPTGSYRAIENSIKNKLYNLPGDYTVYPGHGDETSLEYEREHNPYV